MAADLRGALSRTSGVNLFARTVIFPLVEKLYIGNMVCNPVSKKQLNSVEGPGGRQQTDGVADYFGSLERRRKPSIEQRHLHMERLWNATTVRSISKV
jgi:hypothetical protein